MYAIVSRRRLNQARTQETRERAASTFFPALQRAPGFVSFSLVEVGTSPVRCGHFDPRSNEPLATDHIVRRASICRRDSRRLNRRSVLKSGAQRRRWAQNRRIRDAGNGAGRCRANRGHSDGRAGDNRGERRQGHYGEHRRKLTPHCCRGPLVPTLGRVGRHGPREYSDGLQLQSERVRRCKALTKFGLPCKAHACWDDQESHCMAHAGRHHHGPRSLVSILRPGGPITSHATAQPMPGLTSPEAGAVTGPGRPRTS